MSSNKEYTFVASCAAGLEELVSGEITEFNGSQITQMVGGISWVGDIESAYRACLWSRFASRILLTIDTFIIGDTDDLYNACIKIDWTRFLDEKRTFAVSTTFGADPVLTHSHYSSLRVKDAVVDFFRELGLERPNVAKEKPDLPIHLYLKNDQASLYLDLSGDSLHRRGYRKSAGIAPLKESLAAAIVALSGWDSQVSPKIAFVDPMCGSATLLIEAALIFGDSAPGLSRNYFGFDKWLGHDEKLWSELVSEAVEREENGFERSWPRFIGYDADPEMVAAARINIKSAGLEDRIEVKCQEFAHLQPPGNKGFLVSNLPYGERLSEKSRIKYLYSCVGRKLQSYFQGWQAGIFVGEPDLADSLGLDVRQSYKLFNGPLACRLFTGDVAAPRGDAGFFGERRGHVELQEGVDFANRLKKNHKKIGSWAQKNGISCFRLYDRDLPDYNVTIDVYDKWVQVQEYLPPSSVDMELSKSRFSTVLFILREVFQIKRDRIFIKRRQRQRGKSQYEKKEGKPKFYEVRESKCTFLVNFTNYLDTGLFLDHRPIREKIASLVRGKRFLNLYGYTGTATVHAAKGGAALTTTVDLSANYLEWAHNNLALNGFSSQSHELVQQDCLTWLKEAHGQYDLIFIDPPTFSNSKKKQLVFDVQRDHLDLLLHAYKLLEDAGLLFFSTNFKGFKLDQRVYQKYEVVDISRETTPFDFQRARNVHRCWQLTKR
jgi:23S rRNA (guanine2445-N2)-methyltransferase / 23S rRNA (guanine2069-N7)-methyltransferase